jgi:hypothetical protein
VKRLRGYRARESRRKEREREISEESRRERSREIGNETEELGVKVRKEHSSIKLLYVLKK